jgi:hypothetical protein
LEVSRAESGSLQPMKQDALACFGW